MTDPRDSDALQQLRAFLRQLVKSSVHDPATAEFLLRFIRTRIRALETLEALPREPDQASSNDQ